MSEQGEPKNISVPKGWLKIANSFLEELEEEPNGKEYLWYIKEKWATLNIGFQLGLPEDLTVRLYNMSDKYVELSCITCQECGSKTNGKKFMNDSRLVKRLCISCAEKESCQEVSDCFPGGCSREFLPCHKESCIAYNNPYFFF